MVQTLPFYVHRNGAHLKSIRETIKIVAEHVSVDEVAANRSNRN